MGQFAAGRWAVLLSVYFLLVFLVLTSVQNAAPAYDLSTTGVSGADSGFFNDVTNPRLAGGSCSGRTPLSCRSTLAVDNETCSLIAGCVWTYVNPLDDTSLACSGLWSEGSCEGVTSEQEIRHANETFCTLIGCTWTSYLAPEDSSTISSSDSFDWSSYKNVMFAMFNFSYSIGIPARFQFIFNLIFIWLPGFMLMISIFFAIPWIH